MNPQRHHGIDARATRSAAARPIEGQLGGQVGEWHRLLVERLLAPYPVDTTEKVIAALSRCAGPFAFVLVLSGLLYML